MADDSYHLHYIRMFGRSILEGAMKVKEVVLIVVASCAFVAGFVYVAKASSKPVPAKIEKIATVKMGSGTSVEVIGIRHRGQQCYLVLGNTDTRLINMKADLVCP